VNKVIYVAGAFRADSSWRIEQNVRRAEEAALKLWKEGWAVICPHTMTRFYQDECPDDVWLDGCMALLFVSDAAYFLKGWQGSLGSIKEHEFAKELELDIIYEEE